MKEEKTTFYLPQKFLRSGWIEVTQKQNFCQIATKWSLWSMHVSFQQTWLSKKKEDRMSLPFSLSQLILELFVKNAFAKKKDVQANEIDLN